MTDIYDPKNFEPRGSVGYLVSRVRAELFAAIDQELAPFGVTSAQYAIMGSLVHQFADSASGLCKVMAYDPGAMTRMVDRLEAKGLIRRVRHPRDRRAANLELTEEGRAVFPRMRAKAVGVLNRFLRGFTRSEVRQLEDFLQRILANA